MNLCVPCLSKHRKSAPHLIRRRRRRRRRRHHINLSVLLLQNASSFLRLC